MRSALSLGCLACSILTMYFARKNVELKRDISYLAMSISGGSGCSVGDLSGTDKAGRPMDLRFPRDRAMLVMSARTDCEYCKASWGLWDRLVEGTSREVDSVVIYGEPPEGSLPGKSGLNAIYMPSLSTSSLGDLISRTPTIVLLSRRGAVLGRWVGALSKETIGNIERSIRLEL